MIAAPRILAGWGVTANREGGGYASRPPAHKTRPGFPRPAASRQTARPPDQTNSETPSIVSHPMEKSRARPSQTPTHKERQPTTPIPPAVRSASRHQTQHARRFEAPASSPADPRPVEARKAPSEIQRQPALYRRATQNLQGNYPVSSPDFTQRADFKGGPNLTIC